MYNVRPRSSRLKKTNDQQRTIRSKERVIRRFGFRLPFQRIDNPLEDSNVSVLLAVQATR